MEQILTEIHYALLGEKTVEQAMADAQANADTFETQPEIEKFKEFFGR